MRKTFHLSVNLIFNQSVMTKTKNSVSEDSIV